MEQPVRRNRGRKEPVSDQEFHSKVPDRQGRIELARLVSSVWGLQGECKLYP